IAPPGAAVKIARASPERFGGIVEVESPRALLHVDRQMMRELGYPESPLWQLPPAGPLSAPREVHVVLSRRCAAGCRGCYVDANPGGAALPFEDACRILDELAAMGVFHVALGGGEALELDYLFAVAAHARRVGITPNLTTSGLGLDAKAAEKCRVFGQINVSVDGVGAAYAAARGFDGFRHAECALRLLRAVKREVGVNCVVSRSSFPRVPEVARRLVWRERIRVKLDCSFAPMVFWHRPSAKAAAFFGVQGCVGGDVLAAVQPEGAFTGCSFTSRPAADARIPGAMAEAWHSGFSEFRDYAARAPEPCASCEYLRLCNGGCRAVGTPDPGCPRVQEHRSRLPLPVVAGSTPLPCSWLFLSAF